MTRPRIWVILLGTIGGIVALVAALVIYVITRGAGGLYADTFDANLKQSQPVIGKIVEADPTLRALMLEKTRQAYQQGGWPAATRVFYQVAHSEIAAYAGDAATRECEAAWQTLRRSLLNQPRLCRALLDRRVEDPQLKPLLVSPNAVCEAAMRDGGRRRMTRASPDVMADTEYDRFFDGLSVIRDTSAMADDRAACQAEIDKSDKILAQAPVLAARALRTADRNEARRKQDTQPQSSSPAAPMVDAAAPDLHCAAPGTVFTLSMYAAADGLPVTWQSLGQKGWDCQIRSSVSGERGLWGDDRENPLRLLWPLAVGKVAKTSFVRPGGADWSITFKVIKEARYWAPWGWVHAFAIEQEVHDGEANHYRITRYWSPELGFQFGHNRESLAGRLPEGIAPDWQVIAIDSVPRSLAGRGAILTRRQAEEDIRAALTRAEAVHPNLFWNADRRRVLNRMETLITSLPEPTNAMDVYLTVAELAGMLGDGHVQLNYPPDQRGDVMAAYLHAGGGLLLATVDRPAGNGVHVYRSRTDGLVTGDVLTTINGVNARDLFARVTMLEPGEAEFKQHSAQRDFGVGIWSLGIRPPFVLEGVFANVPGRITSNGWIEPPHGAEAPAGDEDDGLHLKELPSGIFLLDFTHMTGPQTSFRKHLGQIFAQITKAHATGLVIDLRGNGGGNTERGDDLLTYITDKPRRVSAHRVFRASAECRSYFAANLPVDELGEAIKTMPDGATKSREYPVTAPPANSQRFTGPVAVLIGPGTFSAANMLANEISDFRLATLLGRDTAEIANNYGMACPVRLPNTGMELFVPSTFFARASGEEASREDVHPDIRVPRPKDLASTEDVDLNAARRWLLSRLRTSSAAP